MPCYITCIAFNLFACILSGTQNSAAVWSLLKQMNLVVWTSLRNPMKLSDCMCCQMEQSFVASGVRPPRSFISGANSVSCGVSLFALWGFMSYCFQPKTANCCCIFTFALVFLFKLLTLLPLKADISASWRIGYSDFRCKKVNQLRFANKNT